MAPRKGREIQSDNATIQLKRGYAPLVDEGGSSRAEARASGTQQPTNEYNEYEQYKDPPKVQRSSGCDQIPGINYSGEMTGTQKCNELLPISQCQQLARYGEEISDLSRESRNLQGREKKNKIKY